MLKKNRKEPLDKERVDYCLNGWKSVLNEHSKVVDEETLNPIAEITGYIAPRYAGA